MRTIIEGGFVVILCLFLITSFTPPAPVTEMINPFVTVTNNNSPSVSNFQSKVLAAETSNLPELEPVNILLLGLDARIGDTKPRCDAIHMVSFDPGQNKITITSVPRGTKVPIPGIDDSSAYLANSCAYRGIPYAVTQIENITNIHPDFIVKVGFSQTLGILRHLGLPTTPTLELLRNRRFAIGDYQRSHDQALFLREMLTTKLADVNALPKPLLYLLYKTVDTDIPFETAVKYLQALSDNGKIEDGRVTLVMKPSQPPAVNDDKYSLLKDSYAENIPDQEYLTYQQNVVNNISTLASRAKTLITNGHHDQAYKILTTPFSQKIWLQIEDENTRNTTHFQILKAFVNSSPDQKSNSTLLLDFINEMEITGDDKLKSEAETLLQSLSTN
jgi:anionic cell wall polymer biosynthesis LytR-Cps2A-Psr (LCP) family protein